MNPNQIHPIQLYLDQLRPPIETICLAEYVEIQPNESILEIGCGSGYISFFLAWKYPNCQNIVGIDIVDDIINQASKALSGLQELAAHPIASVEFRIGDIRILEGLKERFDVLVCNPPFFQSDSARPSPQEWKTTAHRDDTMPLETLFEFASRQITSNGRFYLVFPACRMKEIECKANQFYFLITDIRHHPDIRKRSGGINLITLTYQEPISQAHA